MFYQGRAENLSGYIDIGLTALKLGEEALVDLKTFDLASNGKEMKALRYTWNRGQRDGLSLEFHAPGQVPMAELQAISDAWLQGKNVREKGFSLGRFSPEYLAHFRVVVVRFEGRSVDHVAIYIGEGRFVHAPRRGTKVRIDRLNNSYWQRHFQLAKRVVPEA